MMYAKALKRRVERMTPGVVAQVSYHGCHTASVQVFPAAGGPALADLTCRCEDWGGGRLDVRPSVLVAVAARKAATLPAAADAR
jgi:hypothetical protein